MRYPRTTILAGAMALLLAGTAQAATDEVHEMSVAMPDGSIAHIEYVGDVAPKVTIEPVDAFTMIAFDPFADFERIAAAMEARRQAMLMQLAALGQAAAQAASFAPAPMTLVGNLPPGVRYSFYSSTTDASGCTRTVEYRSDGGGEEPRVTHASAGNCDSAPENRQLLPVGNVAASELAGDEV